MTEPGGDDIVPGSDPSLPVARDATGAVTIGSLPSAPAGSITLAVRGGTLYLDPLRPDGPPTLVLTDPAAGASVVAEIFGDDAGLVLTGLDPDGLDPDGPDPDAPDQQLASVPYVRTEPASRIGRLGVLAWLCTSPVGPSDRPLLALEVAVAAAGCRDLLDQDDASGHPLTAFAEPVLELARQRRSAGSGPVPPGLDALIANAVDALVLDPPDDPALAEELRHEADLRAAMQSLSVPELDWDAWLELAAAGRPTAAAHAGGDDRTGDESAEGRASVDWLRAPSRVLDPREGTISWVLTRAADDGSGRPARLRVSVSAAAPPPSGGLVDRVRRTAPLAAEILAGLVGGEQAALSFAVYGIPHPLPLCIGDLTEVPGGGWSGEVLLPVPLTADQVVVDVHRTGVRSLPPSGPAAADREAMRWAARGLTTLRIALAAGTGDPEPVRATLERARQLFGVAATGVRPAGALRRRSQCDLLLATYLARLGQDRQARRVRARLEAAADLPDTDLLPPDLDHPAWRPGVAELSMLNTVGPDA